MGKAFTYITAIMRPYRNVVSGSTVELSYHGTKVDPAPDYIGCFFLLVGLPLAGYSFYLLLHSHDIDGFLKFGSLATGLIAASFLTPKLFRKSKESYDRSYQSIVVKGQLKDAEAEAILTRVRSKRELFWLYLRPFTLENEILVVSVEDQNLFQAPNLIRYHDEGFADPKHQPVDLFDNLQRGFGASVSSAFVAVGRRPHPLHDAVGYVESRDEDWQRVIQELISAATLIVCMPWDTPGVLWESALLVNHMLNKTLFVMPPCYKAVSTVKVHGSLFPFPWFSISPLDRVSDYMRRWSTAIEPLQHAGLQAPEYNWCGMLFGYTNHKELFTLRIPVHPREFWLCYPEIEKRLSLTGRDEERKVM